MGITDFLIDIIGLPALIANNHGDILYKNEHLKLLFKKLFDNDYVNNIISIDTNFDFEFIRPKTGYKKILFLGRLKVKTNVYKTEYNEKQVLVYIFDNVLFNKDIVNIFNHIEDIIDITNDEGIIEMINDAVYKLTEMTKDDVGIGKSLLDLHKNSIILTEPAFSSVIKEKKPITKRIKYSSGVTLLNRGYPVFSENGDLEKTIIFGQNVSQLTALQERIILSEEKNRMTIVFDDIEHFFKDNGYVFASDVIKKIVNMAIKIASTDTSVFISGESGVGKEIITKIIHKTSKRKNEPFIDINCSAIPSELFESELFGYEQGSFTGSSKYGKRGLLEEANGGTILLDEIGDMPFEMQSKLLRVIQEKKIRRIGSNTDIPIDIRYISATNIDINEACTNKIFRSDLYYRLSEIPIHIPPLRERKEDIIVLINHFLHDFNKEYNKAVSLSNTVIKKLITYNWPGNVRELRNVVQRLVLLSTDNLVKDIELSEYVLDNTEQEYSITSTNDKDEIITVNKVIPLEETINIVENILINKVYNDTLSIVKTAKILEIDPSTIHRKIKSGKIIINKSNEG